MTLATPLPSALDEDLLTLLCTVPAILLAFAATVHAQAPDWKKVRIGVEGAYPPFSEIGTDGKLKGFDIDIAYALCEKMKVKCELVQAEFDAMVKAKKADGIAIVPVFATVCRGCNVNIPPQMYNELQRVDRLKNCPNCERIIYWDDDPSRSE